MTLWRTTKIAKILADFEQHRYSGVTCLNEHNQRWKLLRGSTKIVTSFNNVCISFHCISCWAESTLCLIFYTEEPENRNRNWMILQWGLQQEQNSLHFFLRFNCCKTRTYKTSWTATERNMSKILTAFCFLFLGNAGFRILSSYTISEFMKWWPVSKVLLARLWKLGRKF